MDPLRQEVAILEESHRRRAIARSFFEHQAQVWRARRRESKHTMIKCPRRSGKSTLTAGMQLDDALDWPMQHYPYIGPTGPWVRTYIWPIFVEFKEKYLPEMEMHPGDLTWRLPNGANGKLWGADREDLLRSFYGGKNRIPVIDEAAMWRIDLRFFFEQVLEPTVADKGGYVVLCGAPGPVMAGLFYEGTREERDQRLPGFDVHEWGVPDNPYMVEALALMEARWAARDPHYREKPWYRRQWLGLWVAEADENVYAYDPIINTAPEDYGIDPAEDQFVLGMDTGFSAGMAWVVMSYSPRRHPNVMVHESKWKPELDLEDIADIIQRYRDRYRRLVIIADPNNAQLNNDLQTRYKIPLIDAQKTSKREWIRIINTEFGWGRVLVMDPEGANVDLTMELNALKKGWLKGSGLEWDDDGNRIVVGPGEWTEDLSSSTNHCCDALLYGFRYCHGYMYRPVDVGPAPNTPAYFEEKERKLREEHIAKVNKAVQKDNKAKGKALRRKLREGIRRRRR